jgi:hypothetical protein
MDEIYITPPNPNHFLAHNPRDRMRDSKKYPDDMVENFAESPGMCSDGPGSAPIEIPKREAFSLRRSKKERRDMTWVG